MAELTDAEIDAARERGRLAASAEPRAASAIYDKRLQRLIIELSNGISISIPPRLIEGLGDATPAQLAGIVIQGQGYGLRWPALDVDMSVPGLIAGAFGTRAYLARKAGEARSKAKAAAARKNGAKGGRPRKKVAA